MVDHERSYTDTGKDAGFFLKILKRIKTKSSVVSLDCRDQVPKWRS